MTLPAPSLLSPANGANVVGLDLTFAFTVPISQENKNLVFKIELDTVNPPSSSSSNYKAFESRSNKFGFWYAKDINGTYIKIHTAGVGPEFYGHEAKVVLKKQFFSEFLTYGQWFWRVSASDGLVEPPVFNKVIFNQTFFRSV